MSHKEHVLKIGALQATRRWAGYSLLWIAIIGSATFVWVDEPRPIPGEHAFRVTTLVSLVALALLGVPFFRRRAGDIAAALRFIVALVVLLVGLSAGRSLNFTAAILSAAVPPGVAYLYAHRIHRSLERARTVALAAENEARHVELVNALERLDSDGFAARQNSPVTAQHALMALGGGLTSGLLMAALVRRKTKDRA